MPAYFLSMTKLVYDEEASRRLNMDVVHEVHDTLVSPQQWAEAMRRLNSINDPLARRIVDLHRDCGTGTGPCDDVDGDDEQWPGWGCDTVEVVAEYYSIEFPDEID